MTDAGEKASTHAEAPERGRPVLFVLVDALRWDYLSREDTPFLHRLAEQGGHIRRIIPGHGFCERAELWTGAPSAITDAFTALTLDWSGGSPAHALRPFLECLPMQFPRRLDRILRLLIAKWLSARGRNLPLYEIPFPLLPYCTLTEDLKDHRRTGAFPVPSFFEVAAACGRTVFHDSFTALGLPNGNDLNRLDLLERNLGKDYDFFLLYLGDIDYTGHYFGTRSGQLKKALGRADSALNSLWRKISEKFHLFVLGDHGMVDVDNVVDILHSMNRFLAAGGLALGKDYVSFVDSTMVRVWVKKERARKPLEEFFAAEERRSYGRLLDSVYCRCHGLPAPGGRYGDFIWAAYPGVLVHPSFFHRYRVPVAMHGYSPDHEQQAGCLVASVPLEFPNSSSMHLRQVGSVLAHKLGFRFPPGADGEPFRMERRGVEGLPEMDVFDYGCCFTPGTSMRNRPEES